MTIIDVETGEVLFEGSFYEGKKILQNCRIVPNKRLYENYGFTDSNYNNIYVITK